MARAILEAAETADPASPEAEFAKRWAVGPRFQRDFGQLLDGYYDAVTARLRTQAGFDAYFELAAERRQEFKAKMPIAEFPLLLPHTNITPRSRRMRRNGTVAAG